MKKILVVSIAMAVSGIAFAEVPLVGQQQQSTSVVEGVSATSDASNAGNTQSLSGTASTGDVLTGNTFENGAVQIGGTYYDGEAARELNGPQVIDQRIEYSGEYKMKNTPNASAPALTTTMTETCMGSSSVGGAAPGFGLSFGTTWRDSACVRRLDARQLSALGYNLGAKELMCDSDAVRAALQRAGTPCYNDLPNEAKRPEDRAVVAPAEETPARGYNNDLLDSTY